MMIETIRKAKQSIRLRKKWAPWTFTEYFELNEARRNLLRARKRFKEARKAWQGLGK